MKDQRGDSFVEVIGFILLACIALASVSLGGCDKLEKSLNNDGLGKTIERVWEGPNNGESQ